MGTLGGKIGFVAGMVVAVLSATPMIDLFLGSCFWEQGCGRSERLLLACAALAALALGIAAGLLARAAVNAGVRRLFPQEWHSG